MDRIALHKELYDLVGQPLQDAVTLALRSYSNRASSCPDPDRWIPIKDAAERIGDAFQQISNEKIPLAGALRNLATRSVELAHIAHGLDRQNPRHLEVIERLERTICPLKDRAAALRLTALAEQGAAINAGL